MTLLISVTNVAIVFACAITCETTVVEEAKATSYAFGKKYVSRLSRIQLAATPYWRETDENPPVSARKAVQLAERYASDNVTARAGMVRKIESVSLEESGKKWYWRVTVIWVREKGASTGIPDFIDVIVLMDATVVRPEVTNEAP